MKNLTLLLMVLASFLTNSLYSQVTDMTTAKAIAMSENKFIILDFWADWCQPCNKMDRQLWSSEEFAKLKDRFVLLKVNVDRDRRLPMQHRVKGIPRVIVMTSNEDVLMDETGFRDADSYLDRLSSFPSDISQLNTSLVSLMSNKKGSPETYLALADEYSKLAHHIDNSKVAVKFYNLSGKYAKKCRKSSKEDYYQDMVALISLKNSAYRGKYEKTLKKMKKLKVKSQGEEVKELQAFISAYCYHKMGKEALAKELKAAIKNQDLLAELN